MEEPAGRPWKPRKVSSTSLVIHAHFYQPPRENPWTEEVPRERDQLIEWLFEWWERIDGWIQKAVKKGAAPAAASTTPAPAATPAPVKK